MECKKRAVDSLLDLKLESFGATLITGPKGCGKTTSAKQKAKSIVAFQDEEQRENLLSVANTTPRKLLTGDKPRTATGAPDFEKRIGTITYLVSVHYSKINIPNRHTVNQLFFSILI